MPYKTCFKCGQSQPSDQFKTNNTRPDGKQAQCVSWQKAYRRGHYLKNRERYVSKADKYRDDFRTWWEEVLSTFWCISCGEQHPACLDFHHIEDNKESNISTLVSNCSRYRLFQEMKKCVVLCSNCHRKLHYDLRH